MFPIRSTSTYNSYRDFKNDVVCSLCEQRCIDIAAHLFCHCPELNIQRERFWNKLIQSYDVSLESYLVHLSDFNFVNTLLGATIPYFENNAKEHLKFLKECATYWNIPKPSLVHYVSKPHLNA